MASSSYRDVSADSSTKDIEELSQIDFDEKLPLYNQQSYPQKSKRSSHTWSYIHCMLIMTYSFLFACAAIIGFVVQRPSGTLEMSPARSAIEFQEQYFHVWREEDAEYFGEPSEELDAKWSELLSNTNIRIYDEEFRPLEPREGIKLPDGGYMATINAYHQLHCLKRLYRYMFPEYYFPDISENDRRLNKAHNFHCLDTLRQSIMCQGDTSVITMKWAKHDTIPQANWSYPHQCVNWDRLNNWASERRIDPFAEGYLIHPTLGPAYPLGYNPSIGVTEED